MYQAIIVDNPFDKSFQDYSSGDCCAIVFFVIFIIIIISLIIGGCCYRYDPNIINHFTNNEKFPIKNLYGRRYNALYTSPDPQSPGSFMYTQPPGDVDAQMFGSSGQGTSGGFLPLQGRATGTFMKNSSTDNLSLPSPIKGKIGGGENYMKQQFSSRWNGFNNFGSPFSLQKGPAINDENYSNSYLIDGGNMRVMNSGQKGQLPCQYWWPTVKKGVHGFCTQGSDAIVTCETRDIAKCRDGDRFLKDKFRARWKKVVNP